MRVVVAVLVALAGTARAAPPEPSGPHPRMLLDRALRASWAADAKAQRGPIVGAIRLCQEARDSAAHDAAVYQGSEWAKTLQACLVAWAATEQADYSKTAIRFFKALLDDLDRIGDGQGGDNAARRDDGYAIRNLGPYTALAYDWLHAGLPDDLKARARRRWAAWLDWYRDHGYRARGAGTNYQAGYLAAATLIAVAQAGEAGKDGAQLWRFVADELWAKDMAAALAAGGILEGGDWPEGWQYGPLAVAHYALAARIARRAGIPVDGIEAWLASMLKRHVYGLAPGDRVYAGQDTEDDQPNLAPHVLTLGAIALGDGSADDKKWAKGELSRLQLVDRDYLLYDALATVGDKPVLAPRATWPTWYVAAATGTVFARTRWDDKAIWFVAECQRTLDVDHRHPKAGNFVLSRGKDDVIVDPSPYGSQSTLTGNAPTVASGHLPKNYLPSQGTWSEHTGWDWTTQTRSGVVALRCDYADQYRFQHRASDVPDAIRDLVLVPGADGTDAVIVVIDRATTGGADRRMYLRFRVPGGLALDGDRAATTVGGTRLAIASVQRTSGEPVIGRPSGKDCFKDDDTARGRCDAARFPVTDYRVELTGPEPRAVHVISATGGAPAQVTKLGGDGWTGVKLAGPRDAVVVWPTRPGAALSYKVPRGKLTHVILDAAEVDGKATVTAKPDGPDCAVTVAGGGAMPGRPAIVALDDGCAVTVDPAATSAASATGTQPRRNTNRTKRAGCCAAQAGPETPLATTALVGVLVLRRRRRPGS